MSPEGSIFIASSHPPTPHIRALSSWVASFFCFIALNSLSFTYPIVFLFLLCHFSLRYSAQRVQFQRGKPSKSRSFNLIGSSGCEFSKLLLSLSLRFPIPRLGSSSLILCTFFDRLRSLFDLRSILIEDLSGRYPASISP